MFAPVNIMIILIFLGIILTYAILFYRQQKKLSEIKALLLMRRKELEQLKQRNGIIISEIARVKPEYKKKLWDLKLLRLELGEVRDDIRDNIENIRKDREGFQDVTGGGPNRVVERRKKMLQEVLEDYQGRKSICLERQQILVALDKGLTTLTAEKDDNIDRLERLISQIRVMEIESNEIGNSPLLKSPLSWRRRKTNSS